MNFARSIITGALLLLFAGLQAHAATVTIIIRNNFFSPNNPTIRQGDTVVWVQQGQNHDTVSEDGLWSSGILGTGQTFSFTFDTPGVYRFYCTPHRSQGMTGRVTVQADENTPPSVNVTAPADQATFTAGDSITFSANANDNGSVASVEFFANGASIGSATGNPFTVTAALAEGNYAITAKATDNLGASTTSAAVNITVQAPTENQLPTITLASSQPLIEAGGTATLTATASDPDGTVAQVEFFEGANSIGSDTGAPFELPLSNLSPGVHSVTAVATDNSGGKTTSSALEIRVAVRPRIESIQRENAGTTIAVTGTTGIVHTLEATTDLSSWSEIGTVTPENGTATITDNAGGNLRLYRVVVR